MLVKRSTTFFILLNFRKYTKKRRLFAKTCGSTQRFHPIYFLILQPYLTGINNTMRYLSLAFTFCLLFSSCATHKICTPEQKHIVGHYEYVHSWDYTAPDKQKMHCDETGTLDFYDNGTFADTALQHHKLVLRDPSSRMYDFNYRCLGNWKVENHQFMFNELSEGFVMEYIDSVSNHDQAVFAQSIAKQSTPNSMRWFTFQIERLDRKWFIWSYTYPDGRKGTWEMRRKKQ